MPEQKERIVWSEGQRRLVSYAVCFLLANWDEDNEDDLGMTEAEARAAALGTGLVKLE